jgi:flavin reductase (DIM6/NTAB) family NADH-FMN oxidoreductase RutF
MRHTLAGFATGVSVVAAEVDGVVVGMSANSLVSVSLDPPLVSVAFARTSTTWPILRRATSWGISVLAEHHRSVLEQLRRPSTERFGGIDVMSDGGAVFVDDSIATLTVTPYAEVEAGDHVLTLLRVHNAQRHADQRPLIFYDSAIHRLSA